MRKCKYVYSFFFTLEICCAYIENLAFLKPNGWELLFLQHIYWSVADRDAERNEQPVAHTMSMSGFPYCGVILSLSGFFQFSLEEFQEIRWILSQ